MILLFYLWFIIKKSGPLVRAKHLVMLHFVYFDGTSAFVDDANFVCDEDTTVLFKTNNFDEACQYVDDYNEIHHVSLGL